MSLPVRKSIERYTPTVVARAMGLPISTIHRWMTKDCIPGKGPQQEWRRDQFETAIAKLRDALKRTSEAA